jgi:predicted porin
MKKTLIALAALASTAAFAQSTVNLTGVVGFGYQQATDAAKTKGLTNTDATIAVAVAEDLGGGMRANAAIAFDTASSQFGQALNRRNSSVGLSGGFGSVSITNTRSGDLITGAFIAPSYLPDGLYDASGIVARAPIDVLTYTSPKFGAFTGTVQFVEWNTDGNTNPAYKTTALTVNYAEGPLAAAVSFKATKGLPAGSRKNNVEALVSYDLGVARVAFGIDGKTNESAANGISAADAAKTAIALGVSAPLGPVTVGLNYAKRNDNKVTEVAAKYDLSKRTSMRASFGKQSVDASNQYRLAVVHTF